MTIGEPRIGQVIRYSFLWSDGKEKERPAVIILALKKKANNKYNVAVMPITHTPHSDALSALEIPQKLKKHLKLDDERAWGLPKNKLFQEKNYQYNTHGLILRYIHQRVNS